MTVFLFPGQGSQRRGMGNTLFNALLAAGAFDFATGLRLVKKRGELMSQAAGGGMAAVIGFTLEQVQHVL